MKKLSSISKTFASLALMSSSIWIGSYVVRLFIVYNLFEAHDPILKSFITNENINGILSSLLPAIFVHFIAFIIMFLSIILFVATSKIKLRMNGWLFIILLAVLVTTPFEIYLMFIDYKIITMLYSGSFNSTLIIDLLKDRMKDLSSFSIVLILTYLSFFYFIIFQPLTKVIEQKK